MSGTDPTPLPPVTIEDANHAITVLERLLAEGHRSFPGSQAYQIFNLSQRISAGEGNSNSKGKVLARCYICRRERQYELVDNTFALCDLCKEFNEAKRAEVTSTQFEGQTALVTGGRINLGYAIALILLRGGASKVLITTRFIDDSHTRYALEPDHDVWKSRLHMIQSDFTSASSIQHTIQEIHSLSQGRLDILINNAAQTVPIPDEERERLLSGEMSLVPSKQHPLATLDGTLVTSSSRPNVNAWTAKYNEFSYKELLDVLAVNAVAPFVVIRECVPLMKHSTPTHIINVSSREGMFEADWRRRSGKHVHTNMAKAALNMMTQTLSRDFKRDEIFINSVDPGYLSHQHAVAHNGSGSDWVKEGHVPLTWEDGAARVLHPVIRQQPVTGLFFKDYRERDWLQGYV